MQVVGVYIELDPAAPDWVAVMGVHQFLATQVVTGKTIAETVCVLGEAFDDHDLFRAQGHVSWLKAAPSDVWEDFEAAIPVCRMPLGKARIADVRVSPALAEILNGRN